MWASVPRGDEKKNGLVHRVLRLAVDRFEQNPRFVGAHEIDDGFSERLRFRFQMRIVQGVGDELASIERLAIGVCRLRDRGVSQQWRRIRIDVPLQARVHGVDGVTGQGVAKHVVPVTVVEIAHGCGVYACGGRGR